MTPEDLLLVVMLIAVTCYAVLGGADFGAGVWEFTTRLRSSEQERSHLYRAIGPVWEANHVWVIFVLVILMNGFPVAFAALSRALWLPLLLAVAGIVFRGAGYVFRSYGPDEKREQTLWEAVFAAASTASPLFLGAAAGAIAGGKLKVDPSGGYRGDYLTDWGSGLSLFTGFYSVGMCAYLAAVYLVREADHADVPELSQIWRRRALRTGVCMGVLSVIGLVIVGVSAPALASGFLVRGWPLVAASLLCGIGSLLELGRRNYSRAVVASTGAVVSVIWGWGVSQYPLIVPPGITASIAKAPDNVLWLMLLVILLGGVLLIPSLVYLLRLFKAQVRESPEG